jgi:hypothetical protein
MDPPDFIDDLIDISGIINLLSCVVSIDHYFMNIPEKLQKGEGLTSEAARYMVQGLSMPLSEHHPFHRNLETSILFLLLVLSHR